MRKHGDDSEWEPLEEKNVELVEDFGSTYLRARLHHFTWFSKCRHIKDDTKEITWINHLDGRVFQVRNATDSTLLVVTLPTEFVTVKERQVDWGATLGADVAGIGGSIGVNHGRRTRIEAEPVSTTELPYFDTIAARGTGIGAKARRLDLLMNAKNRGERLIICSIDGPSGTRPSSVPASPASTAAPASMVTPASTMAPASGTPQSRNDCGEGPPKLLRLHNVMRISGGRGIVVHQARLNTSLNSKPINSGDDVVRIAQILAGIIPEETTQPSGSKMWLPKIFRF